MSTEPASQVALEPIFVIEASDKNARVVFETLTDGGNHFAIVQKYLPDIVEGGDSRVLLVDGEPVPYALSRIPTAQDHRGNLAAGAQGVGRPLNDRDRWLCQQIGPAMSAAGMLFVPSIGGISHHWSENTDDADIVTGAHVFVDACRRLLAR